MLVHGEKILLEMDSVFVKNIFVKNPEQHQLHFCSTVYQSQSRYLDITLKHRENMPFLQSQLSCAPCAPSRLRALPIIDTRLTHLRALRALPISNTRLARLTRLHAYAPSPSSIKALRAFLLSCYRYRCAC